MIVSIDYDLTYTVDPAAWRSAIEVLQSAGHEVICVTGRRPDEPVCVQLQAVVADVIYTGGRPKAQAAKSAGWWPDIWIDDTPESVGRALYWGDPHE